MNSTKAMHLFQELPSAGMTVSIHSSMQVFPEYKSNIFSRLTFSWIAPLLKKGYKRPLEIGDMWELPPPDKVSHVGAQFEQHWQQQLECGVNLVSLGSSLSISGPLEFGIEPIDLGSRKSVYVVNFRSFTTLCGF
jgi:hypothetical protein